MGTQAEWLQTLVGQTGANGNDGAPGQNGNDGAPGQNGNDGAPGQDALWFWQGDYNDSPQYQEGDIVAFEGATYRRNNVGNSVMGVRPTDTAYWSIVAERGVDGSPGNDAVFMGTFNSVEDLLAAYPMPPNNYYWAFAKDPDPTVLWIYRPDLGTGEWVAESITIPQGPQGDPGPGADQGLNTTDSVQFNGLTLTNGDDRIGFNGWNQIVFGYDGSLYQPHYIRTRHDDSIPDNNAIDFYTNSNQSGGDNPPILGLSVANGVVIVRSEIKPQDGNDLNLKVWNPTVEGQPGGVTISLQNRDVESGGRNTQLNVAPTNITLTTDFDNNQYQWVFDASGNLTIPATGDITRDGVSAFAGGSGGSPLSSYEEDSTTYNTLGVGNQLEYGSNVWINADGALGMIGGTTVRIITDDTGGSAWISTGDASLYSGIPGPTSGGFNWQFGGDGTLTLPIGKFEDTFNDGSLNIVGSQNGYVELLSFDQKSCVWAADEAYNNPVGGGVGIATNTDNGGGGYQWLFGPDGVLNLPPSVGDIKRDGVSVLGNGGGTIWTNPANGCLRAELSSTGFQAFTDGTHLDLQDGGVWNVGSYQNNTSIGNDGFANPSDLWLRSGSATFITSDLDYGDGNQWMFSGSNIQLPNDGDIVRWNGSAMVSVLGGNANTGNYTFSGNTITNNNGFTLDAGSRGTITLGTFIEVPGVDTHFHIAFPNSNIEVPYQDLYLGNDYDYVKIRGSHNEQILGVDIGAGGKRWEFNPDGTTIFPDNIIDAGNNSLGIKAGDNISQIYLNDNGSVILSGYNPDFDPIDNQLYEALVSVGEHFGFNEILGTNYFGPTLSVGSAIQHNGSNGEMLGLWTVDKDGNLITAKATIWGEYSSNTLISAGDIRDSEGNSLIYVPASDTAPAHNLDGLLWYNSDEGRMYIKYMGAWVDASPTVIPPSVDVTQLTNGENTVTLDTSGFLEFSSGGAVGNVQQTLSPSGNTNLPGIDLYATPDMAWAQLNYANTNYVWVDGSAAYFDVEEARLKLKSDGILELNKLFGATIRLGELRDGDAVLWVDPSPDTEYLGLWWAGNTNYNQTGQSGYGPDAGINIGVSGWDDSQGDVNPDTKISLGIGDLSWSFLADGSIRFPYQPTNNRTGSGDAFVFAKNPEPSQKIIATQAGNDIFPTVERLVIAGGDGYGTGEGGDIYLWAGRSGANGGTGGDIKVDAGNSHSSEGGTVKVRGGNVDGGATPATGGRVEITAGSSWNGGDGANVYISAGDSYNGSGTNGNVEIYTNKGSRHWEFRPDGILNLPASVGDIYRDGVSVLNGNAATLIDGGNASSWLTPV